VRFWSTNEKKIMMTSITSTEAIQKYFRVYPNSDRSRSSVYTYWWWRHHPDIPERDMDDTANINIEPGDYVQYSRGSRILSPIGVVIDTIIKRNNPMRLQKIKVQFDNYNIRDVYACDYTIVQKGVTCTCDRI
jgi:hypothetical protein